MYREICQRYLSEFHSTVWEKSPKISTKYIWLCCMAIIAIFLYRISLKNSLRVAQNIADTCQEYFQYFIAIEILSQRFCQILQNVSSQHYNFNILKYFWEQNKYYGNCKNKSKFSIFSCVTAYNFAIIFTCIYVKIPYDDHYNFLSPELDGQLPLNSTRWWVKLPLILHKSLIKVVRSFYLLW